MESEKRDYMDLKIFQDFLANFFDTTPLRAQIIADTGFVVASYQADHVGMFHEEAYRVLQSKATSEQCVRKDGEEAQQTALYVPLIKDKQIVGILELCGEDSQSTRIYAQVMKLSIESMMNQGANSANLQKYASKYDLFIQKLLYDPQVSRSELEARAEKLGYRYDCMRIPVFITTERIDDFSGLLQQGESNPYYNKQDIMALSRSGNITLLIYLGQGENVLRTYREYVTDYLAWWQKTLSGMGLKYQMYIGSIQSKLLYYRTAYEHAVWLHNTARCEDAVNWFYDHTEAYLKWSVPAIKYKEIFNVFAENLPEDFLHFYEELMDSLIYCAFNLNPASKRLFVHKNTLSFRLGKVKERLNINPMQNPMQRDFASNFCLYLRMFLPGSGGDLS